MSDKIDESDVELFLKVIKGDERAFNNLYIRHKDFVMRTIKRKAYNLTVDFDDLTQKVWLKLFRTKMHYSEMSIQSLLFRICDNICADEAKKMKTQDAMNKERTNLMDEIFSEDMIDLDVQRPPSPDQEIENKQKTKLTILSDDQLEVFNLKAEGMKNKEIAQALDLSEHQVKYLLKLARNELANFLLEKLNGEKKEVFTLKIKGLEENEIAQALDMTEDQVKHFLALARNELAKYLQD